MQENTHSILAIETASMCGGVALVRDGNILAEMVENVPKTHSTRLLPNIQRLLEATETAKSELSAIAVSVGPGSFTGIRIGISTAKSIAFSLGIPCIGVPTLDAMAMGPTAAPGKDICPVLDARKKEVYTALYRYSESGTPEKISEDLVIPPEKLVEMIKNPTVFIGDAVTVYRAVFEKLGNSFLTPPPHHALARPAAVASIGWKMFIEGKTHEPKDLMPNYVRLSEAEILFGKPKKA